MRRHGTNSVIYIAGEGPCPEPPYLSGAGASSCPLSGASPAESPAHVFKFGRMFKGGGSARAAADVSGMVEKLTRLGHCMNAPAGREAGRADESDIPAGYTYLGQFIAHEITFHKTEDLAPSEPPPGSLRSPQLDLDCLYGAGPDDPAGAALYEDRARLKVGRTTPIPDLNATFANDLPRGVFTTANPKEALIADPRNDENLCVAQTHLAFVKFHNKVVDSLAARGGRAERLFECARKQVVQHFQWLILEDYLPRLLDAGVLGCVRSGPLRCFDVAGEGGPFMPVEFSAAAFRIGHSMIRDAYEWNAYHSSGGPLGGRPARLLQLFRLTNFSGDLDGSPSLQSDWVVDWRRFYDFEDAAGGCELKRNRARKIDTIFDLRLDQVPGYPHQNVPEAHRPITVRNLLRGLALGLPTGEEMAEMMGEPPLSPREVVRGPHEQVLSDPAFYGRTPLWYYILKEAELNGGNRLGPVGSRIVAETFVGLIRQSPYSVLNEPGWRPTFGRREGRFGMADLLSFADCVDPIGRHFEQLYG